MKANSQQSKATRKKREEKGLRGDTDVVLFVLDWQGPLTFINIKSTLPKWWTIVLGRHTGDTVRTSGRWGPKTHLQLPLIAIGAAKDNETEIFEIDWNRKYNVAVELVS